MSPQGASDPGKGNAATSGRSFPANDIINGSGSHSDSGWSTKAQTGGTHAGEENRSRGSSTNTATSPSRKSVMLERWITEDKADGPWASQAVEERSSVRISVPCCGSVG